LEAPFCRWRTIKAVCMLRELLGIIDRGNGWGQNPTGVLQ